MKYDDYSVKCIVIEKVKLYNMKQMGIKGSSNWALGLPQMLKDKIRINNYNEGDFTIILLRDKEDE